MARTILVVEDEMKLRDLVRQYLEREGFSVLAAGSGVDALALAADARPTLGIVDLGLPDIDGEAVAGELRRQGIPVIILTARSSEADRVRGLELGADDYATKPFSPRELVLRVQAVLRRSGGAPSVGERLSLGQGTLVIDEDAHEVMVRGTKVELTPTEWSILAALAGRPRRVFSRLELANRSRGYEYEGYERTTDSHIKNLRRKIELDPTHPTIIETVTGTGYRMTLSKDAS